MSIPPTNLLHTVASIVVHMNALFLFTIILISSPLVQAECRSPSNANVSNTLRISEEDADLINEAYRLQAMLGDSVWPGWSKVKSPLVYLTRGHEYAINFPRKLNGFARIEMPLLQGRNVQVRKQIFDPKLEASLDIDGIPAVVIGSPENIGKSSGLWVITATHEMFHVYQAASGGTEKVSALKLGSATDAMWQLDFPFPYKNDAVMNLIHLQGYPIYLAISGESVADARYNNGVALEAISVYRSYLSIQSQNTERDYYHYSQFQEWYEGIARYAEYKMAELAAKSDHEAGAKSRGSKNFDYKQLWEERYKNQPFLIKHAGKAARSRTAFYHLGFGKGLLLDRLLPDWKSHYFGQDIWLNDLLLKAAENR